MSHWKLIPGHFLYFATSTIVGWQHTFISPHAFEILIDAFKFCIGHKGLHLHGYVIMPNHVHYIVSTEPEISLSDAIRDFSRFTSKKLTEMLIDEGKTDLLDIFRVAAQSDRRGNKFMVWQGGFHPIALESESYALQKLEYIHANPVKKGFVEQPEHWKYSSARNYVMGDTSIIPVELLM